MTLGEETNVAITASFEPAVIKKILRNFLCRKAVYYKLGNPCTKAYLIDNEETAFEALTWYQDVSTSIPVVLDQKSFCLAMRKISHDKLEVALADFCGTESSPDPWIRDFNTVNNYLDLLRYSVLLLDIVQEYPIDSFFVGCPEDASVFDFPFDQASHMPLIEARPLIWPSMLNDVLIDMIQLGMQKGFIFMNTDGERLLDSREIANKIARGITDRNEDFLLVSGNQHLLS